MTDEQLAEIEARDLAHYWWLETEHGWPPRADQIIDDVSSLLAHIREQATEIERLRRLELERSEHLKEMQRLGQEFDRAKPND